VEGGSSPLESVFSPSSSSNELTSSSDLSGSGSDSEDFTSDSSMSRCVCVCVYVYTYMYVCLLQSWHDYFQQLRHETINRLVDKVCIVLSVYFTQSAGQITVFGHLFLYYVKRHYHVTVLSK